MYLSRQFLHERNVEFFVVALEFGGCYIFPPNGDCSKDEGVFGVRHCVLDKAGEDVDGGKKVREVQTLEKMDTAMDEDHDRFMGEKSEMQSALITE
jgi:hypothetical protein